MDVGVNDDDTDDADGDGKQLEEGRNIWQEERKAWMEWIHRTGWTDGLSACELEAGRNIWQEEGRQGWNGYTDRDGWM